MEEASDTAAVNTTVMVGEMDDGGAPLHVFQN